MLIFAEIIRLLDDSSAKKFVPKVVSRTKICNVAITCQSVFVDRAKRSHLSQQQSLNIAASIETIRARLRENNLKACSAKKCPLTIKHAAKRMKFAKEHSKWPMEKWRNIDIVDGREQNRVVWRDRFSYFR